MKKSDILAETPQDIASVFLKHADHEKARLVAVEFAKLCEKLANSHATNAVAIANFLVSFTHALPNRGIDAEVLDAISIISHSICMVNARQMPEQTPPKEELN